MDKTNVKYQSRNFSLNTQCTDPKIVVGKEVSITTFTNVMTTGLCENLIEGQDELDGWRPWDYPCWMLTPELGEGKIALRAQGKEFAVMQRKL